MDRVDMVAHAEAAAAADAQQLDTAPLAPKPLTGDVTATPRPVVDTRVVSEDKKQAIGFLQAWLIPGVRACVSHASPLLLVGLHNVLVLITVGQQVAPYALSYACLKAVNYALFFCEFR